MVSGQATQPDTQADCPFYDTFAARSTRGIAASTNPNYGQLASAAGPNAAAGQNGCVYPASVQTLFNQFDAAHVSWKGYAQDLGNPETGSAAAQRRRAVLRRPVRRSRARPAARPSPTRAAPTRPTSTCPSTSRSRGSSSILQLRRLQRQHIANLFDPANGLFHDLQSTSDDAGVQLDLAEQLQRRARRGLPRQQPVRRLLRPEHAQRRRSTSPAACTRPTCSSSTSSPRSRRRPAFKDGGLIDVTFDEAFPPFTYTGNSFANSTIVPPNAATSIASDSAGETLFGQTVHFEPTGPNTPLAKDAQRQRAVPGPGRQRLHRPARPTAWRRPSRPSRPAPACSAAAATSRARAPTPGATAARRAARRSPTTRRRHRRGPLGHRHRHPGRRVRRPRSPTRRSTATAPAQSGGLADTGSFTLVDAPASRCPTTGRGQRRHPRRSHRQRPTRCSTRPTPPPAAATPAAC